MIVNNQKNCLKQPTATMPSALITSITWNRPLAFSAATSNPKRLSLSNSARAPGPYTNKLFLEGLIRSADEIYPEAIFAVHLDHGDEEACMDCIESGFYSSVMIDASHEEFEVNIGITKRIVDAAHARGIVVEAELGQTGRCGRTRPRFPRRTPKLTNPDQAKEFVDRTGCDSLAVAIGTSHGAFKFSGSQSLHFDVLAEIQKRLPGFPLVMHGSSSVPPGRSPAHQRGGAASSKAQRAWMQASSSRLPKTRCDQDQHRHRRPSGLDPCPS